MNEYNRILFVGQTGVCREAMAAAILGEFSLKRPVEVLVRGLVVLFQEPMNQKAEAVLISNGISVDGFTSYQLLPEDLTDETLVVTMETAQKSKVMALCPNADENHIYSLRELAGEELDILDPYGGPISAYGLCYESLRKMFRKIVKVLNEEIL